MRTLATVVACFHMGATAAFNSAAVAVVQPQLRAHSLRAPAVLLAADENNSIGSSRSSVHSGSGSDGSSSSSSSSSSSTTTSSTRSSSTGTSSSSGGGVGGGHDVAGRAQAYWDGACEFGAAFRLPKIDEDTMPEALALHAELTLAKEAPHLANFRDLATLTGDYYKANFNRTFSSPAVTSRMPGMMAVLNGAFVLVFLRLLLPRLLAMETLDDIDAFAPTLGLPTREELQVYVQYAEQMDYATKLGLFLIIITLEKVGSLMPVTPVRPRV